MFTMNLKKTLFGGITMVIAASLFANSALAAEKEIVGYRLQKWKTIHFDDGQKANIHIKAVKKLGCEVKKDDHGSHIDVTYRCPKWQEIALKTHDSARQWEKWLKASGFETKHAH